MQDFELNIRVCNRLLNKIMKRDFGYDCVFRINSLFYMNNRFLIPETHHFSELVYLKSYKSLTLIEREQIRKSLNENINLLLRYIEGRDYRPILDIKLKIIQ